MPGGVHQAAVSRSRGESGNLISKEGPNHCLSLLPVRPYGRPLETASFPKFRRDGVSAWRLARAAPSLQTAAVSPYPSALTLDDFRQVVLDQDLLTLRTRETPHLLVQSGF